jgi:hypothetical protein
LCGPGLSLFANYEKTGFLLPFLVFTYLSIFIFGDVVAVVIIIMAVRCPMEERNHQLRTHSSEGERAPKKGRSATSARFIYT